MHEPGEIAPCARALEAGMLERWLAVRRATLSRNKRQDELVDSDHAGVAQGAAELLPVLPRIESAIQRPSGLHAGSCGPVDTTGNIYRSSRSE